MDLNFQSFDNVNSTNEQSGGFGGNIGDRNILVGGPTSAPSSGGVFDDTQSTASTRKKNLLSFEYYQQFFDVETDQVMKRLLNSVVPTHRNYIQDFLQPIPDLWGPFWVSVTLVFAIGIFGNLAQFVENDGAKGSYGSDFRMVTSASTIILLYVLVVPLLIYGLLWNRRSEMLHPYIDIVCLYGYSLSIFIPVSFLWIIDIALFRWALIFISVGLSGTVLARAIWPAVQNDTNKMVSFGTIITIVVLHFLLAFTFKEFYFDAMHPKTSHVAVATSSQQQRAPDDVTTTIAAALATSSTGNGDGGMKKKEKNETSGAPEAPNMIVAATDLTSARPKIEKRDSSEIGESTTTDTEKSSSSTVVKDEKIALKPTPNAAGKGNPTEKVAESTEKTEKSTPAAAPPTTNSTEKTTQ